MPTKKKKSRIRRLKRIYWLDFLKLCFGSYPVPSKKDEPLLREQRITRLIIFGGLILFLIAGLIISATSTGLKTGEVGDAFNGLVGPFIALLSAILLYRSFAAQIEANKRQTDATLDQIKTNKTIQSQWMYETYISLFDDIRTSYNKIKVIGYPGGATQVPYLGEDALKQYAINATLLKEDKDKLEKDLDFVLKIMNRFFNSLSEAEIQQKDFMMYLVTEFYKIYMQDALYAFTEKVLKDGRDKDLEQTLKAISYSTTYYLDLLKRLEKISAKY